MILRDGKGGDTEVGAETVNAATGDTEGVGAETTTETETRTGLGNAIETEMRTDLENGIGIETTAGIAAVVVRMMPTKGVIDDEEIEAGTDGDQDRGTVAGAVQAQGPVDKTKGPRLKFIDASTQSGIRYPNSTNAKRATFHITGVLYSQLRVNHFFLVNPDAQATGVINNLRLDANELVPDLIATSDHYTVGSSLGCRKAHTATVMS